MLKIKSITEISNPKQWKTISAKSLKTNGYPVYGANGVIGYYDNYTHGQETLLITCRGATCGSINICAPKSYVNGNAMAIDDLSSEVDLKYLYYYLINYDFSKIISGTAQPQITREGLKKLKVAYPPLEVQKRIVKVLDESKSLIDLRKKQIELLNELIQSVFYDMFGDPIMNPMGWEVKEFGEYLIAIDSGWSPKCYANETPTHSWGVLKLSAVTGGRYKYFENKQLPNDIEPKVENEISQGDLLFTRKNTKELVGACAFVFDTPSKLLLPDTIFRLVTKEDISKLFIWGLFNNKRLRETISSLASGSAASMPNISKSKLRELKVIIPPIDLQLKYSKMVYIIEQQSQMMYKSLIEMENNFNSLIQRAFKGELFS